MIAPMNTVNPLEQEEAKLFEELEFRSANFWITGFYRDYYDSSNDTRVNTVMKRLQRSYGG